MPYIEVKTNVAVSAEAAESIKSGLGSAITAIPGKSETWLMVSVCSELPMWFQGDPAPCAIAEIMLYGSSSPAAYNAMTAKVTDLLSEVLGCPAERIYVKYEETSHWGYAGSNL